MSARDLIASRRDQILTLAQSHGATQVRIIGSVARGADRPDSDIDFLVLWEPWTSLLDHAALTLQLERALGRRVDIASEGWIRPELRESIYRDAQPL